MSAPLAFRWTGDIMEPLPRFVRQCNETFVVGAVHIMEEREERSSKSHAHFFAQLADCWANLPPDYDGRWPSPEHFRKYLLIKTGNCDHRQHPCATKGEATRLRAALAMMDSYSIITQTGCLVEVFTAQSMSSRAMNKERFQACKDAIFQVVDEMLGTDDGQAEQHSARAA